MLKRVVIDARMVGPVPHGISRYVSLLARGLAQLRAKNQRGAGYEPIFLVQRKFKKFDPSVKEGFSKTHDLQSSFLTLGEVREIPRALKHLKADLYHSPSFSSLLWSPCPWVQTVHDLNHLQYGKWREQFYYKTLLRSFSKRAKKLISVSNFSAHELSNWLEISQSRIAVVPNALEPVLGSEASEPDSSGTLSRLGLINQSYFLTLSNSKPHKNLGLLIRAHAQSQSPWSLVLPLKASEALEISGPLDAAYLRGAEGGSRGRLIALGSIPESQAQILLSHAGAVAFPSLYEGFGLPPLEAAARGIPAVVSDIPAHREALSEVPSESLIWASPFDQSAWAQALKKASTGTFKGPSYEVRQRLLEHHSLLKLGTAMDRIYRDVLGI